MAPALETPPNRLGYWGPPTATIDWCEDNYIHSFYIAEFWNTVSNACIFVPPLYGLYDVWRNKFIETRFDVLLTFIDA